MTDEGENKGYEREDEMKKGLRGEEKYGGGGEDGDGEMKENIKKM